jgi:hypothetical protein
MIYPMNLSNSKQEVYRDKLDIRLSMVSWFQLKKKLQLILLRVIRMFVVRLTVVASRLTDVLNKF